MDAITASIDENGHWYHVAMVFQAPEPKHITASIVFYVNGEKTVAHQIHDDADVDGRGMHGHVFGQDSKQTRYGGSSYIGWAMSGSTTTSGTLNTPALHDSDRGQQGTSGFMKLADGNNNNGFSSFWGGIDEVSVWNKALSPDDISKIYNDYKPCDLTLHNEAKYLVSWYRMGDDERDSIAIDLGNNPLNRIYDQQSLKDNNGASSVSGTADSSGASSLGYDSLEIRNFDGGSGGGYSHGTPFGAVEVTGGFVEKPLRGRLSVSGISPVAMRRNFKISHEPAIADHTASFTCGNVCVITPSALYARREPVSSPTSVYYVGDAAFEAHQGSRPKKEPFYDSYDAYSEDIKRYAKDFSIIPEFRISEHMDYFMNEKNGDFLADLPGFLTLTGSNTDITSSSDQTFYKLYSHSDMLRFFKKIREDHEESPMITIGETEGVTATAKAGVYELTLQCEGIMKFLPYDGFYPAQRTLQIASQLSSSIAPEVKLWGSK
jgi:hypothetical protein